MQTVSQEFDSKDNQLTIRRVVNKSVAGKCGPPFLRSINEHLTDLTKFALIVFLASLDLWLVFVIHSST